MLNTSSAFSIFAHHFAGVWRRLFLLFLWSVIVYSNCIHAEVVYGNEGNISFIDLTVPPPLPDVPAVLRDICPSHCDEEGHKYKAKQCIMPPHCCRNGWLLECCSNASRAISDEIQDNFNCVNMTSEYWQLVLAVCVPLATLSLIAFLGMTSYLMCRRKRARQHRRQRTGSGSDVSCSSWSVSTISPNNTVRGNPLRSPGSTPECGSRRHRRGGSESNNNNNPHCDIFVVGSMSPSIPPPYIDKPPPYSIACNRTGSNRAFDMVDTDSLPDYYELVTLESAPGTTHSVQVASIERETQVDAIDACPEYEEIQEVNNQSAESAETGIIQSDSQVQISTDETQNQYEETVGNQGHYFRNEQEQMTPTRCSHCARNSGEPGNQSEIRLTARTICDHHYLQIQDSRTGEQHHHRNVHRLYDRETESSNIYHGNVNPEQNLQGRTEHEYETLGTASDVDHQRMAMSEEGLQGHQHHINNVPVVLEAMSRDHIHQPDRSMNTQATFDDIHCSSVDIESDHGSSALNFVSDSVGDREENEEYDTSYSNYEYISDRENGHSTNQPDQQSTATNVDTGPQIDTEVTEGVITLNILSDSET